MGRSFTGQTTSDTTVTTTTETVAATVGGISTRSAGDGVVVTGFVQLTTGTGTTAVTVRVRRGTGITGTVVGEANAQQIQAAAGSTEQYNIEFEDSPGEVAGQSYALTVQQTGASGNGSILAAHMTASLTP